MTDHDIVIDNEKVILVEQLRKYLEDTNQASIAVGYFFISGFAEIMDSLKKIEKSDDPDNIMRILISPTTNRLTAETMLAGNEELEMVKNQSRLSTPRDESIRNAKDEVKRTLEYMPQIQNEMKATRKLIDLIRDKKVKIKVYTRDKLHAKAYVFELDNKHLKRVAIVGSSNLSISGIKEHAELNLRTTHPDDANKVKEWFDRHWNDENCQEFTEDIAEILKNSWAGREYTSKDVFGKASLHENDDDSFIVDDSNNPNAGSVELFDFQKKAVVDALAKLDKYGGVIIADVVGMGKSFVGSKILQYLKKHDRSKPLIICPPHLEDMWRGYLKDFEIYGEVISRYKIGMKDDPLKQHSHCDVILIDESHNFRNTGTNSYDALSTFMDGKTDDSKVVMLTATPISNSIKDLKNQLKLFPSERISNIPPLGTNSLDEYFRGLETPSKTVTPEGAIKIQELLKHILIRRTRTQIIERYAEQDGKRWYLEQDGGRKYFPERHLQNPEEYDADKVYNNYELIETAIRNLILARYAPGRYLKVGYEDVQKYEKLINTARPLIGIVRTTLLKRMESSIKAFEASVSNYLEGHRIFCDELKKGRIPVGKEFHDEIYKKITDDDYDDTEFGEAMSSLKDQYDIEAFDVDLWIEEIEKDLTKFAQILGHLSGKPFVERDDKLHKLASLIDRYDEKILIFSESAVTTKYIYDYLKVEFKERKIAQIDSKQDSKTKSKMIKRFDPKHNKATIPEHEQIDILISTDVLSEGVNLHAGRIVINYDFHWNPVRLIQRVGRVDRIGSEHPKIEIFNFLPTTKIDATLSLKERVSNKIETIRQIIGTDQQILESTEPLDAKNVSEIYDQNDGVLDYGLGEGGLLDIAVSASEERAVEIKKNPSERVYYENLPFGIRNVSGSNVLYIACEAVETVINETRKTISSDIFRRHYKVTKNGAVSIWQSQFLKIISDASKDICTGSDSNYNGFIATAWGQFKRDMGNTSKKKHLLKHQKYFEDILKGITTSNPELEDRVTLLLQFVKKNMRGNFQPYRSLVDLHKKIDHDSDMDNEGIIDELEKIHIKFDQICFEKRISKPRILYSMMVTE